MAKRSEEARRHNLGEDFYELATKRLATITALKDYAKYQKKKHRKISGTELLIVIALSLGENDNIGDYGG